MGRSVGEPRTIPRSNRAVLKRASRTTSVGRAMEEADSLGFVALDLALDVLVTSKECS
jgi:hypothetical protein